MTAVRSSPVAAAHGAARVAVAALVVNAVVALGSAVESCVRSRLVQTLTSGGTVDIAAAARDDARWDLLRTVVPVAGTLGGVLFLLWLHRTYRAGHALGVRGLTVTPGMAVAMYFIPLANLVRPYQHLRDLHDALDPAALPERAPTPRPDGGEHYRASAAAPNTGPLHVGRAPLAPWWTCWLLGNAMGAGAFFMAGGDSAADVLREARVLLASDVVTAVALALAAMVVLRVDARLQACHRALSTG